MSKEVDQKIVEMQFDNKQFEKGVATTMTTLDRFNKALEFKDSSKGFVNIQNGIDSVKFDRLLAGVETISQRFTTTGLIVQTLIRDITSSAYHAITNVGNKITSMVKTGGINRALNIEQAKFQLKGLGVAWDDIKDDIDYGVKDTAYGLDAAAKVASQLVASQVSLGDEMKAALRGVSGVAAMTSSSYEEIGHIFTTVAGNGRLMTEQLQQFSYRGLNAAATLAKAMGVTEAEIRDMVTKGQIDFKTFATAMDSAFGEHAKDANSIFTGAMSNVKAALSRVGANIATPALERLTKVFNNLIPVINNFNKTLEPLYAVLGSLMDVLVDKISRVLDIINLAIGPAYKVLEKVVTKYTQNMVDSLTGLETWLTKTFNLDPLIEASDVGKKAIESLTNAADDASKKNTDAITTGIGIITEQEAKAAWDIWQKGLYGVGEERRKNIEAEGMSYEHVQGYINALIDANFDLEKVQIQVGDSGTSAMDGVKDSVDKATDSIDKQAKKSSPIIDFFVTVKSIGDVIFNTARNLIRIAKTIHAAFKDVFPGFSRDVATVAYAASKLSEKLLITSETADKLRRIFKGVFSVIDMLIAPIKALAGGIVKLFKPLADDMEAFNGGILETLASFGDWLYDLDQAIKKGELAETAFGKLISMFQNLPETLKKVKDTFLKYVNEAIDAVEDWSGIDIRGKFSSMIDSMKDVGKNLVSGFTSGMKEFIAHPFQTIKEVATAIIDKFKEVLGIHSPSTVTMEMAKNLMLGFWEGLKKYASIAANAVAGAAKSLYESLKSGLETVAKAVEDSKVIDSLGELIQSIWRVLGSLFTSFTDAGAKAVTSILDGVSSAFNDFADWLNTGGLKKAWEGAKGTFEDIRNTLFGGSKDKKTKKKDTAIKEAEDATKAAKEASSSSKELDLGIQVARQSLSSAFGDVKDFAKENIGFDEIFGTAELVALTKVLLDLSSAAKKLGDGLGKFFGSLGESVKQFNKMIKPRTFRTIALSVSLLAGSIAMLALADPKAASIATGLITGLFFDLMAAMKFMQDKLSTGLNMVPVARAIRSLAISVAVIVFELNSLAKTISVAMAAGNGKSVIAAFTIISGFIIELLMAISILQSASKETGVSNLAGLSTIFVALSAAIAGLTTAMIPLTLIPADLLAKGEAAILGLAAVMVSVMWALMAIVKETSKASTILSLAAAMDLISGAILALVPSIVIFALIPAESLWKGVAAVGVLTVFFDALMYMASRLENISAKTLLGVGVAIQLISNSILTLMVPVKTLGEMKLADLIEGLVAVAALLAGVVIVAKQLSGGGEESKGGKEFVLIGVGMIALATGLKVMAKAVKTFGSMKWEQLAKAGVVLGVIFAGLVLMSNFSGQLKALSLAFIGFSSAIFILGSGLLAIAKAGAIFAATLVTLSASWDLVKDKATTAAQALGEFLRELCNQIIESKDEITGAIRTIFMAIFDAIYQILAAGKIEWIPLLVDTILQFLESLLTALDKRGGKVIKLLVKVLLKIVVGAIDGVLDGLADLVGTILDFIIDLLDAIAERADEIVEGIFKVISAVVTGFLNGIEDIIVDVVLWFANLGPRLIGKIAEGLGFGKKNEKKESSDVKDIGGNIMGSLIGGIKAKLMEWGRVAADVVSELLGKLRNAFKTIKDIGGKFMTKLKDGFKAFMDDPLGMIGDIVDAIKEKVGEMADWVKEKVRSAAHALDIFDAFDWDDPNPGKGSGGKFGDVEDQLAAEKMIKEAREARRKFEAEEAGEQAGNAMAEGFAAAFQKRLGIASPSKWATQMGEYINQGLNKGLKRSSKETFKTIHNNINTVEAGVMAVVRKTQQMQRNGLLDMTPVFDLDSMFGGSSSLLDMFNETVDVSGKFLGDNMMDNIASNISLEEAINGLSDKLDGFGDDITVHVPVNVNGKTIAEAITPDLDKSLGTRSFLSGRRLAGT